MSQIWIIYVIHMNDSCNTYEWVLCHTYEYATLLSLSHTQAHSRLRFLMICRCPQILLATLEECAPRLKTEPYHTCEWVKPYVWMSHATHVNKSCRACEWVISHMNESRFTYEWVVSHVWMSHVTHGNESCHTCAWFTPHIWMSHVTVMHESCHTH